MTTPQSVRTPTVSVCIPTFNGAHYLGQALACVQSQSFTDYEVVVCDDGSSDGTVDVAYMYADAIPVRVLRSPRNLGMSHNWNRCMTESRGEWIKFLFQDDLLDPRCLEVMLSHASGAEGLVVCDRNAAFDRVSASRRAQYLAYRSTVTLPQIFGDEVRVDAASFCRAVLRWSHVNFVGEPVAVMFRRDLIDAVGLFDPTLIQLTDFEYWCRLGVSRGMTIVPETLATFRVHEESATVRNTEERAFRANVVDPLIFRHAQLVKDEFKPLRDAASASGLELRAAVMGELAAALRMTEEGGVGGQTRAEEMNRLREQFPTLDEICAGIPRGRQRARLRRFAKRLTETRPT